MEDCLDTEGYSRKRNTDIQQKFDEYEDQKSFAPNYVKDQVFTKFDRIDEECADNEDPCLYIVPSENQRSDSVEVCCSERGVEDIHEVLEDHDDYAVHDAFSPYDVYGGYGVDCAYDVSDVALRQQELDDYYEDLQDRYDEKYGDDDYDDPYEDECIVGRGGGICPCCGGFGDPGGRNARRRSMFS